MLPPFVWIRDRLWTVANWSCDLPTHAWLLLRPATKEENDNYLAQMADAETEAYYTSVLVDADRSKGRPS